MLTAAGTELDVFVNFVRDLSLPKFQELKSRRKYPRKYADDEAEDEGGMMQQPLVAFSSQRQTFLVSGASYDPPSRMQQLWQWLLPTPRPPRPALSVQDFFRSIHNSTLELATVASRAAGYEIALLRAKQMGQTALLERLEAGVVTMRAEAQLVALGLRKYLEEATVVEFVKQSPQGLRLDWLANFTRLLPEDLQTLKAEADRRGCFDNYAVLHYDPARQSHAATQAELVAAARRDPILFGLMASSRKLYYIGDWVDETCALTLQQIVDALGAERVKAL